MDYADHMNWLASQCSDPGEYSFGERNLKTDMLWLVIDGNGSKKWATKLRLHPYTDTYNVILGDFPAMSWRVAQQHFQQLPSTGERAWRRAKPFKEPFFCLLNRIAEASETQSAFEDMVIRIDRLVDHAKDIDESYKDKATQSELHKQLRGLHSKVIEFSRIAAASIAVSHAARRFAITHGEASTRELNKAVRESLSESLANFKNYQTGKSQKVEPAND